MGDKQKDDNSMLLSLLIRAHWIPPGHQKAKPAQVMELPQED